MSDVNGDGMKQYKVVVKLLVFHLRPPYTRQLSGNMLPETVTVKSA